MRQPMDSCVAPVKSQYRVGAMKAMTYAGHVYGLPEFTNQLTLIVNQSAFKSAGVPISAASTTNWKQRLATAKKLTKFDSSGNLVCIGFDPKIDTRQAIAALAFTKEIINAEVEEGLSSAIVAFTFARTSDSRCGTCSSPSCSRP